jgi:hypothetical protein
MSMNRNINISRVLAAAVAFSGSLVVPLPASAVTQLVCAPGSFQANADSVGNITVTCTEKSGTSGGDTGGTTTPPPPPPPTTSGPIACAGYAKTVVLDLPWTAQSKAVTSGFGNDTIVVGRFTTGASAPGANYPANVSSIEYVDPSATRTAALSTSPCDLTGAGLNGAAVTVSVGPSWTYQIGGTAPVTFRTSTPTRVVLQPSTTYYVNIVNRNASGAPSCGTTTCNMILQLTKPTGT